ncbi:MAG: hypothetical protein WAM70_10040, partial [Pyrinomonadaceae bacterium]
MNVTDSDGSYLADSRLLSLIAAESLDDIFQEVTRSTMEWMHSSRCALWWLDMNRNGFRLASLVSRETETTDASNLFLPYET